MHSRGSLGLGGRGTGWRSRSDACAGGRGAGREAAAPAREVAAPDRGAAALARTSAAGAGTRRVAFAGYTIDVPAGWPVYRLARDPYRCVRYDQNAVYLGQPGANQQCPAHLAGRVATLSLAKAHLTVSERRQLPPGGVVAWDSADHEMGALLPRPALSITATYGAAKGQIKGILATLRRAAGQPGQSASVRAATVLVRGGDPPGTPRWPTARFLRHRAGAALVRGALPPGPLAGLSGAGRQAAPRAWPGGGGSGPAARPASSGSAPQAAPQVPLPVLPSPALSSQMAQDAGQGHGHVYRAVAAGHAGLAPRVQGRGHLPRRPGGGVRMGQPVGRVDPGQRADGLGDDPGLRRPAGAVHQVPGADPGRPGGVAGPGLGPERDPPG